MRHNAPRKDRAPLRAAESAAADRRKARALRWKAYREAREPLTGRERQQ